MQPPNLHRSNDYLCGSSAEGSHHYAGIILIACAFWPLHLWSD